MDRAIEVVCALEIVELVHRADDKKAEAEDMGLIVEKSLFGYVL